MIGLLTGIHSFTHDEAVRVCSRVRFKPPFFTSAIFDFFMYCNVRIDIYGFYIQPNYNLDSGSHNCKEVTIGVQNPFSNDPLIVGIC